MFHVDERFDALNLQDKIRYIKDYPEKLLLIDKSEVQRIENSQNNSLEKSLLETLKITALKECGELILVFKDNGFKINKKLINIAFKAQPSIGKFCPSEWFNTRSIRQMLKEDLNNYNYIPREWFTSEDKKAQRLINFLQKQIREKISADLKNYNSLPAEIITGQRTAFTALNSYTVEGKELNALKVNPKLWESNGGKIMFKIARKNLNIALKMLNFSQRISLAIFMIDQDYKCYEKFPQNLKEDKNVKYKFYTKVKNDNDLYKKYFENDLDEDYYAKRLQINEKRNNTLKSKSKQEDKQKSLKNTKKSNKLKKGQLSLFTDEELKALEQ